MTHSAETDSPASKAFATRLAKYAYTPSERPRRSEAHQGRDAGEFTTPSPRRAQVASARKRAHIRDPLSSSSSEEDSEYDGVDVSPSAGPSSRTLTSGKKSSKRVQDSPSVVKKAKKVPRPYAGPEVYAHLNNTPDHLAVGLDIIFCGINPGKKSAATGTHFAHPTNKFWRALHQSGLTPRLYAPSECHLLPADLNYGLTNLCGRPTAEQSELSTLEMRLNVHPFTFKLLRFRPRIVCFVGKKIWDVYEAVAKKTAEVSPNGGEGNGTDQSATVESGEIGRIAAITTIAGNNGFLGENGYEEEVPLKVEDEMVEPVVKVESELSIRGDASGGSPQRNSQEVMEVEVKPDLPASPTTPLRHGHLAASTASTPQRQSNASTMDWYKPRSIRLPLPPLENGSPGSYCYFWVTPSTSGLERTPMAEQANIFSALRQFLEQLRRQSDPPAAGFRDVNIAGLSITSEKIRAEAVAKGKTVYPSVHV